MPRGTVHSSGGLGATLRRSRPYRYYLAAEAAVRRRGHRRPVQTFLLAVLPPLLAWGVAESRGYSTPSTALLVGAVLAAAWVVMVERSTRCGCGKFVFSTDHFCPKCGRRQDALPPGTWRADEPAGADYAASGRGGD